ncbi:hypothetical protein ACFXC8_13550 [Streptomyces sp. NPDC059441]|uniref:hypothetical protein n=1 Tax=Streptomyces sp. NPDC059441 TaxID=3346829 RepID=UPI003696B776
MTLPALPSPDPVASADALWRLLAEHQPAVAAALAVQLRQMPEDWPLRVLGVGRPDTALALPSPEHPLEIEPYDPDDWENCGACAGLDQPCRYHSGYIAGYEALNGPLTEAAKVDPTVTVATALKRLTEAEEAQESGQLAAAVEKLTGGDQA